MIGYIIAVIAGAIAGAVLGEIHGMRISPSTDAILQKARENYHAGYKDGLRMATLVCGGELVKAVKKRIEEENAKATE